LQDYKSVWWIVSEKANVKEKHEILWKGKCESEWSMRSCKNITIKSAKCVDVATLALGLRPKQGLEKVWAKCEAGSHISYSWECKRVWGNEPSHSQMNSQFGSSSPSGFPNLQRVIAGVKTHWIEDLFISLERSWNLDVYNGLAWPIWTRNTQVIAKRRAWSQIGKLTHDH